MANNGGVPVKRDFPQVLDTPGQRIRMLRQSKDLTQANLATRVMASQAAVAHWEADRWLPSRPSQQLLADALGCTQAFLFPEQAAA